MRRTFGVVMVLFCAAMALGQRQSLRQPDVYKVESVLTQAMTVHHIPGASIGVVMDGAPVWTHGYGMADLEGSAEARHTT